MKTKFASLALVTALALGGSLSLGAAAFAANTGPVMQESSSILVVHRENGTIYLNDGTKYVVPTGISLASFSDTENVSLQWQQSGNDRVVVSLTHAQ